MKFYSSRIKKLLDNWPGERYFGIYRFLPAFFILGAALEFSMIKWTIIHTKRGRQSFCLSHKLKCRAMPAGVSWGQYMKFFACAMMSMLAGSQLVHMYYKPLDDLDDYVRFELENKNLERKLGK